MTNGSKDRLAEVAVGLLAFISVAGIIGGIVIAYLGQPIGAVVAIVTGAVGGIVAIVLRERKDPQ